MKLISFNTWGGRAGLAQIQNFFEKYRDADVFCLQEIWQAPEVALIEAMDPRMVTDLLEQISLCLPGFKYFFRPQYRGIYGLATFVRENIPVTNEGELFVFKEQGFENPTAIGNHARNIQYLTLALSTGPVTVVNFHGLWNGQGKSDTEDRIVQSQKIADFLETLNHPYILAGDFNLRPDTQSFRILNEACSQNFIQQYDVRSTRSSFYTKPEKFADYILASPELTASHFEVLPDEASDHLALRVQFDLQGECF
jgi:endonuclease/exonuclease/phosphatase family metal-dependent hydrolase